MATLRLDQNLEGYARLTLTRTESRNAINTQMAEEFAAAVAAVTQAGTGLAVLDAEGPAFCAGADLKDLDRAGDALYAMLNTLLGAPIYWIAVVQGAVRGGGISLLAACPRVLAVPGATFGLPELSRGFFPTSVVAGLETVMGTRQVYGLAFQGRPIDAPEAERLGLVSSVVPDAEMASRVDWEIAQLRGWDATGVMDGVQRWQAAARGLLEPSSLRTQ